MPPKPITPAASPVEAIINGHFSQVRFLLDLSGGANDKDPITGRTPLILCTFIDDPVWSASLSRLLLEKGAKVGIKDNFGLNALQYACIYKRLELTQLFLKAIDYYLNSIDRHKHTALFYGVHSGCFPICEMLLNTLTHFNLSVDVPNKEGVTPLMEAWKSGFFDIASMLEEAGADNQLTDSYGKPVSQYEQEAKQKRKIEEAMYLEKASGRKLRFDDVIGWRNHQERIRSAPPLRTFKSFKEEKQEKLRSKLYMYTEADIIKAASPLDLRNNPTEVFKTTPVDFFSRVLHAQNNNNQQQIYQNNEGKKNLRAKSAHPSSRMSMSSRYDMLSSSSATDMVKDTLKMGSRSSLISKDNENAHSYKTRNNENHVPVNGNSYETRKHISHKSVEENSDRKTANTSSYSNISDQVFKKCIEFEDDLAASETSSKEVKPFKVINIAFGGTDAKRDIPTLFRNYEFQITNAYRKSVKLPKDNLGFVTSMLMHTSHSRRPSVSVDLDASDSKGKQQTKSRKSRVSRLGSNSSLVAEVKKKGGRVSRTAFNRDE